MGGEDGQVRRREMRPVISAKYAGGMWLPDLIKLHHKLPRSGIDGILSRPNCALIN
jgi:hypothetical protein